MNLSFDKTTKISVAALRKYRTRISRTAKETIVWGENIYTGKSRKTEEAEKMQEVTRREYTGKAKTKYIDVDVCLSTTS